MTPSTFFYWLIMKLDIDDIRDRVARTEDEQSTWRKMAKKWEQMWKLDAGFKKNVRDSVLEDGREQVTTPDPYNVVNLAMRLIPSQPKIDVPPRDELAESLEVADQVERWLTAMYGRVNQQQGRNIVDDLKWLLFVRGKAYVEAKWVKDSLPKMTRKKAFPILIRTLDPLNVGMHRGPLYVEWAYHKYEAEKVDVRQRYPGLKKWDEPKPKKPTTDEDNLVDVIDFWYVDKADGSVWNAILVDDEFAKEPEKSDYPIIPIIEACGDTAPTTDKSYNALSILHPISGTWEYKCRLESNLGTAVLWYTWPFFLIESPMGHQQDDIVVRPGATEHGVEGTKVQEVRPQANTQLLETMLQKVDTGIQQATFPQVMYGDAGNMQAGYGVNILSQAATGRIQSVRDSLERALMWLNELVLALVDEFDEGDGVETWGRDEGSEKLYKACLYKEQIDGYYENDVQLKPSVPQDDMQKQTLGIRLADGKYISKRTLRDKYLSITVPSDEEKRIFAEMAQEEPEVMKVMAVTRLIEAYPETWEAMVKDTPLEQMAYRIASEVLGIQVSPPIQELPPMPAPLPPPGIMPPSPQGMQPPAELVGPQGGGIPPEMQGQMGGAEAMGLDPQMNPALFAQMMGQPLPPGEELDALAGGPPPLA